MSDLTNRLRDTAYKTDVCYEAADDIVTRLRHIHMELTVDDYDDVITEAANEIERLRAAGDALVESLDHSRADIRSAVAAWEEARCG